MSGDIQHAILHAQINNSPCQLYKDGVTARERKLHTALSSDILMSAATPNLQSFPHPFTLKYHLVAWNSRITNPSTNCYSEDT